MATIHNGIHGIVSGKVGSLVYYYFRGKQVVRSLPRKSQKPPTEAQLQQQISFGMVVNFFSPLKTLICKGFGDTIGARSGTNRCISYHLKNAIAGTFPALVIDYSKVVLTNGKLPKPMDAHVHSDGAARVNFA